MLTQCYLAIKREPLSPTQHNTVHNGWLQVEKEVATLVEDLEETLPKTEADTEAKE